MISVEVKILGIVQGVFYRASTQNKANELNLSGWVRNCDDGSVEALFQGNKEQVDEIIEWCKIGPDRAVVDSIQVLSRKDCTNLKEGFNIL